MDSWRSVLLPPAADAGDTLALGVELRRREPAATAHWGPRRVRAATAEDLGDRDADLLVGLRPLARGESSRGDPSGRDGGTWVRGGVSWDRLRRGAGAVAARQRAWFVDLYGLAHDARLLAALRDDSEWVTLDTVTSPLLWPHLASAQALGIPIVSAAKAQRVLLASDAATTVRVAPARGGAVTVTAEVLLSGGTLDPRSIHPVGGAGFYAAVAERRGLSLTLAPADLGEGFRALLAAEGGLRVPPADVPAFAREALPRLRRESAVVTDGGLRLPEPDPTILVVTVAFEEDDVLDYRLEWLREGIDRDPWAEIRPDDVVEEELRAAVDAAWRLAPEVDFAAEARLEGVDAAEFVARILPALEESDLVRVETRGRRPAYRELLGDPRITVSTVESPDPDWFDLGVIVEIDGRRIPFTPLFTALAQHRKKLLLVDGSYFSLAHPALDRLRDLLEEAAEIAEWETGPRIGRYHLPLWEDFEDLADEAVPAIAWREAARALREGGAPTRVPLPAGVDAELRPYQREGLDRLALWWRHRLGGVLADDMGLGKTLQVLAFLAHVRAEGERRPFLVVAPTSVMDAWRSEAARFTPGLRVHVQGATLGKTRTRLADLDADIVVTSYGLLRLDEDAYAAASWAVVVLDEAQFVKNAATRQHRAAARVRADMVLAVTGTPLENSLTELWAILSLTCPELFPSPRRFREEYVGPIERGKVPENAEGSGYRDARLARLRARLRPFVLRRTKEVVAPELPARQEQELRVELGAAHRAIYDAVLQRERRKVLGLLEDLDRNRFIVFRSLTLLRRLALSPLLVDAAPATPSASRGPGDGGEGGDGGRGSARAPRGIRSAKLDALRERLHELIAEGHRALVFSQFTSFLDLVRADLDAHGIAHQDLDGATRRRDQVVQAFREGDAPVFLISLKAGGFGLTLTEADYVFLLDPWWNPAAEAQAVDRTHRIGQTNPVTVYRLIANGTIEEKVLALQQRKARLFRSVIDGDDGLLARELTADDIRTLLEP